MQESYLTHALYDLISPDGEVTDIQQIDKKTANVSLSFRHISPFFRGFKNPENIVFNLKSTLAQLGIHGICTEQEIDEKNRAANLSVQLLAFSEIGEQLLKQLPRGAYLGKLFCKEPKRRVRNPDYLFRMFGRYDREGKALLSLGGRLDQELFLEKTDGRCIAYLTLKPGCIEYSKEIDHLLPTVAKALTTPSIKTRTLIRLYQELVEKPKILEQNQILLVKTQPLHIRTVFARVASELLPKGYHHTSADILQPDTQESGDIYELFGSSNEPIDVIPLEFYTLEPHREHVFFSDRDQLQQSLENPKALFNAFKTAPDPKKESAVFVVKGEQMKNLKSSDWITRNPQKRELPGINHPARQIHIIESYIENLAPYPFLKAIENNLITSQGILLTRYFPSPLLKRLLLSEMVERCLKQIYFQIPSRSSGYYFTNEDRALMLDLAKFAIPIFWIDPRDEKISRFVLKPGKDTGMFVPLDRVETFRKATTFGIYGSNLVAGHFEKALHTLFNGLESLKKACNHPYLSPNTEIMLVTGGGPGAMEVGNRVAKELSILSCANIVDFQSKKNQTVNEQKINPYIDAKMTYQLERLVERQAEFYLDFPIFLPGGIGMDFEYALEEVRRKVGAQEPTPAILFGEFSDWENKVCPRYKANHKMGTIKGSEWVSNCFYQVDTAEDALYIYEQFFQGKLPIGKSGPSFSRGFAFVKNQKIN